MVDTKLPTSPPTVPVGTNLPNPPPTPTEEVKSSPPPPSPPPAAPTTPKEVKVEVTEDLEIYIGNIRTTLIASIDDIRDYDKTYPGKPEVVTKADKLFSSWSRIVAEGLINNLGNSEAQIGLFKSKVMYLSMWVTDKVTQLVIETYGPSHPVSHHAAQNALLYEAFKQRWLAVMPWVPPALKAIWPLLKVHWENDIQGFYENSSGAPTAHTSPSPSSTSSPAPNVAETPKATTEVKSESPQEVPVIQSDSLKDHIGKLRMALEGGKKNVVRINEAYPTAQSLVSEVSRLVDSWNKVIGSGLIDRVGDWEYQRALFMNKALYLCFIVTDNINSLIKQVYGSDHIVTNVLTTYGTSYEGLRRASAPSIDAISPSIKAKWVKELNDASKSDITSSSSSSSSSVGGK